MFTPLFESAPDFGYYGRQESGDESNVRHENARFGNYGFTVAEETIGLEIDDVHRVAGSVEVRHADDDDYQRQREDGSLDACRVLNHSEDGAEQGCGDSEHEEEVSPYEVQADRSIRAARSDRVYQKYHGDRHQNAQQYVQYLFHNCL